MTEKLGIPFPLLADPGGTGAITPFGLWSESEGLARSALVLLAPEGKELLRYEGRDYADRPDAAILLSALRYADLPPRPGPHGVHAHAAPDPSERAYRREHLVPYFRGVRSSAIALRGRGGSNEPEAIVAMADRYLAVLQP